jgi:hypothetical protein
MAKMAEGMAHVADGIASSRQQRSQLAMEIRNATRNRRKEVHSLLASMRMSRVRAGHEHSAQAKKMVKARHHEVHTLLHGLKMSRSKASRDYRKEAMAVIDGRMSEMKKLLARFAHMRVVTRQHRHALVMKQRNKAAAFMRTLTSSVAALLDNFDKEGRDRAAAIRERFATYARDRREAVAIWQGGHRQHQQPAGHPIPATPMQASDMTPRSGKRPFVNLGPKGSSGREENSK